MVSCKPLWAGHANARHNNKNSQFIERASVRTDAWLTCADLAVEVEQVRLVLPGGVFIHIGAALRLQLQGEEVGRQIQQLGGGGTLGEPRANQSNQRESNHP